MSAFWKLIFSRFLWLYQNHYIPKTNNKFLGNGQQCFITFEKRFKAPRKKLPKNSCFFTFFVGFWYRRKYLIVHNTLFQNMVLWKNYQAIKTREKITFWKSQNSKEVLVVCTNGALILTLLNANTVCSHFLFFH